ncbi:hypothetical protein AB0G73_30525 [Streptomyces sp. NPDC020719]|uniref:hypothetical protein n=1 Tax=Streptomyces sp. NPDC020719 TaxID=3154896 RepID=UPI0033ED7E3E
MPTTPARQRLLPESLIARTWIGADPGGSPIGFVLLAHPPARWPTDTFADVERKMWGFAAALGLRPPDQPVAELGACVTVTTGPVILSLARIRRKITLPAHARWQRLLLTRPEAAVVVGLVPLGLDATAEQVDRYLDDALRTGRLLLGRAGVADSRRPPPCPVPTAGHGGGSSSHP